MKCLPPTFGGPLVAEHSLQRASFAQDDQPVAQLTVEGSGGSWRLVPSLFALDERERW
jgi:hypothetical protein